MIIVAILGIIAAAALPAFSRYTKRSRTVEALLNIRVMYDGAAAYFVGEHSDSSGAIVPRQFPSTAGPTPAIPPAGTVHIPVVGEFDTIPWTAIEFAVTDPYRYSYTFVHLSNSAAALVAQGDLNGNGVFSIFQRNINGSPDGVSGSSGLWVTNDIE
jgi:type II secretory pathway pseudopilin PulG